MRRARGVALFAISVFGVGFIGYIVWYQASILDAVCASCTTSLALLVALTVISGSAARRERPPLRGTYWREPQ